MLFTHKIGIVNPPQMLDYHPIQEEYDSHQNLKEFMALLC